MGIDCFFFLASELVTATNYWPEDNAAIIIKKKKVYLLGAITTLWAEDNLTF